MPESAPGTDPVTDLLDLLDLETLDTDLFRGRRVETPRSRVYGGQVAAQALAAACRAASEGFSVHSMHSYFLQPGDTTTPIVYDVERIRDGRSFETRRVSARQHGRPIYFLTANFQRSEDGYEHQDAMPEVEPPEEGLDLVEVMTRAGNADADALGGEWAALDVRWLGNSRHGLEPDAERPSRAQMWARVKPGVLADDPMQHLTAFTFASDVSLLGATLAAHRVKAHETQMASLDHSIWFHRPFRADEWWLYDQWSPSAQGARGLALGRVFTADGTLVATVAQEGLIRPSRG
ncbi:acyl-CoA thioesterase [Nocardioides acrostichi]|uniref:Acyl-CoA thioesterase 2 n=1 Tax=Nocardioides acrostichi TaxID=2784339 RepID=A0A930Y591_9ACTN|nr:acyl-CoA thioesterase domain-containing protein [Nocardioides acrostichi]MBF4161015.1 thioesterase family protein [Nocardioides acrostichi]